MFVFLSRLLKRNFRYRTAETVNEKTQDKNSSIVSEKRALININNIFNRNNNNQNTSEITYLIVKYSILLFGKY